MVPRAQRGMGSPLPPIRVPYPGCTTTFQPPELHASTRDRLAGGGVDHLAGHRALWTRFNLSSIGLLFGSWGCGNLRTRQGGEGDGESQGNAAGNQSHAVLHWWQRDLDEAVSLCARSISSQFKILRRILVAGRILVFVTIRFDKVLLPLASLLSRHLCSRFFGNFDGEVPQNLLWEVYAAAIQSYAKLSP